MSEPTNTPDSEQDTTQDRLPQVNDPNSANQADNNGVSDSNGLATGDQPPLVNIETSAAGQGARKADVTQDRLPALDEMPAASAFETGDHPAVSAEATPPAAEASSGNAADASQSDSVAADAEPLAPEKRDYSDANFRSVKTTSSLKSLIAVKKPAEDTAKSIMSDGIPPNLMSDESSDMMAKMASDAASAFDDSEVYSPASRIDSIDLNFTAPRVDPNIIEETPAEPEPSPPPAAPQPTFEPTFKTVQSKNKRAETAATPAISAPQTFQSIPLATSDPLPQAEPAMGAAPAPPIFAAPAAQQSPSPAPPAAPLVPPASPFGPPASPAPQISPPAPPPSPPAPPVSLPAPPVSLPAPQISPAAPPDSPLSLGSEPITAPHAAPQENARGDSALPNGIEDISTSGAPLPQFNQPDPPSNDAPQLDEPASQPVEPASYVEPIPHISAPKPASPATPQWPQGQSVSSSFDDLDPLEFSAEDPASSRTPPAVPLDKPEYYFDDARPTLSSNPWATDDSEESTASSEEQNQDPSGAPVHDSSEFSAPAPWLTANYSASPTISDPAPEPLPPTQSAQTLESDSASESWNSSGSQWISIADTPAPTNPSSDGQLNGLTAGQRPGSPSGQFTTSPSGQFTTSPSGQFSTTSEPNFAGVMREAEPVVPYADEESAIDTGLEGLDLFDELDVLEEDESYGESFAVSLSEGAAPVPVNTQPIQKQSIVGQIILDNFAVMDAIGEGELFLVYIAMKLDTDNLVAVKTVKKMKPGLRERFANAVVAIGRLKHPRIVRSIAYIESPDGQPFYIMEHLQGISLEELLNSIDRIGDEETIASILSQTADAIGYAHGQSIAHGHLTPSNIILVENPDGIKVKVTDFAVADLKNDTAGDKFDKDYISPERMAGEPPSAQSDIYALGVIAYRMITGRVPFDSSRPKEEDEERIVQSIAPFRPDLRGLHQLDTTLQEALDDNPEWRMDSAVQFKRAIDDWIENVHREIEMDATDTGMHSVVQAPPQKFDPSELLEEMHTSPHTIPSGPLASHMHTAHPHDVPDMAHVKPPVSEVEMQEKVRKRKEKRKAAGDNIKSTIANLIQLKRHQHEGEQTMVHKLTTAAATGGQRRSPVATMVRLIVTITICGGVLLGSTFYLTSHFEESNEMFKAASRWLSELVNPTRAKEEAALKALELQRAKSAKFKKTKTARPQATAVYVPPPTSAVPNAKPPQAPVWTGQQSPSFGVTNNWNPSEKQGNRRRIEYRDWTDPK